MPKLQENQVPSYRRHKQSGQAIVTLSGRDHLLGRYGSKESRQKYDRLIGEWIGNGRRPDYRQVEGLTVARILAEFLAHAKTYYRNGDGRPSREYQNFLAAMKPLKSLYAGTIASEFGPRALAGLQKQMIRLGWARTYINRQLGRTKLIFKWAAAQELIPVLVYQALLTVPGLRRGKTEARETDPVKPVAEHRKQLVIPHVSRQVAGLIDLMDASGMRPGEATIMRGVDLDTSGERLPTSARRHSHRLPLGAAAGAGRPRRERSSMGNGR